MALELSEQVRMAIAGLQRRLRQKGFALSWVKPESMHLTLSFLGYVEEDVLSRVFCLADEAAVRVAPFWFDVRGVGYFGSRSSPRVVWAGVVEQTGTLAWLYEVLTGSLERLGFAREKRDFTPHITVARVKSPRAGEGLAEELQKVSNEQFGRVEVSRIVVMRSILEPSGAVYTMLHQSPLKGVKVHDSG